MLRRSLTLALALMLAGVGVTTARASDLCFNYIQGGGSIVAKGFKVPRRNKCAPFNGVSLGGTFAAFSGVGCTSANTSGTELIVHYTLQDDSRGTSGYLESGSCSISVNAMTGKGAGGCGGMFIMTPGVAHDFTDVALTSYCNADVRS